MTTDPKTVLDHVDLDELVKVTLDLANIDSPTGNEGPVADYVHDWLTRQGFDAHKVGLYPDRPNVIATYPEQVRGAVFASIATWTRQFTRTNGELPAMPPIPFFIPAGAREMCSLAMACATARAQWRRGCSPPRPSRTPA